ncbi:PLP-dependent transferase [Setomelanomma holmii]|uniref:PLP-dependent transferase n=1 Tax=Setomelanomma holmii TaxID=210430 RepID=A0A9P4LF29_9PLEO|nr:PLP-dependent transferase [Setomelanomma holmii]
MTGHINLQLGWPSPSLFPAAQLLESASSVLTSPENLAPSLIYGPDAGYEPLRRSIAKWLTSVYGRGPSLSFDRICVTNGASGNLNNVLARFTEPGYTRNIWMVEPSYFLACPISVDSGFQGVMKCVPEDDEGLDIAFLRKGLQDSALTNSSHTPVQKTGDRYKKLYRHIIYCVPTFSNPSAKTMSLRRRQELIKLARDFDALVITDDVYDILRWPVDPNANCEQLDDVPPRLVDLDRTFEGGPKDEWGNAMSNGSFSKIIAPGVRVGCAEATPAFSLALSQMLESGALEKHLQVTVLPTFRSRYSALLKAIDDHLVPLGLVISTGKPYSESSEVLDGIQNGQKKSVSQAGGYFIWILLPEDLEVMVASLAVRALENFDLKFAYGDMMQVQGDSASAERSAKGYGNGIRLSWAWHTADEIVEGIERLASLIVDVRNSKAH